MTNKPRELFDAVGDLALAIKPHNMDRNQREKVAAALHVLVDHIIAVGQKPAELQAQLAAMDVPESLLVEARAIREDWLDHKHYSSTEALLAALRRGMELAVAPRSVVDKARHTAQSDALAVMREAREALEKNHQWHLAQTIPDPEHGYIPAQEYEESGLCETTCTALANLTAAIEAMREE
jgi:hypothetical protein